jgi:transposase InsO family protein
MPDHDAKVYVNQNFNKNLLSISKLSDNGNTRCVFDKNSFGAYKSEQVKIVGDPLYSGYRKGDLYYLNLKSITEKYRSPYDVVQTNSAIVWHRRLSHIAIESLRRALTSGRITGVYLTRNQIKHAKATICEVCRLSKSTRLPIKKYRKFRSNRVFKFIYSDLVGPFRESESGNKYIMTFTDDASRYTYTKAIARKSDAPQAFKNFMEELPMLVPRWDNEEVTVLFTDNGGEFINHTMTDICKSLRVKQLTTTPYTPTSNAIAERINRTIREVMVSTLKQSNLSDRWWEYALAVGMYTKNRLPHRANHGVSPFEVVNGEVPNVSNLRVFGCRAYIHKLKHEKTHKLDYSAQLGIFLGYPHNSVGYIVLVGKELRVLKRRDVTFNENEFPH